MYISVKIPKCLFLFTPDEIVKNMPQDILIKAIKRGKYENRADRIEAFYDKPAKVKGVHYDENN